MSYREAEAAFRERAEELEREIAALDAEIAAKSASRAELATATATLEERIEREGPGGGEAGAKLLRVPLLVGTMLGIGCLALFFQFFLAELIRGSARDIIPIYLIMSVPTFIGTAFAYRFRAVLPAECVLGLVMTAFTIAFFVLGAIGVLRVH